MRHTRLKQRSLIRWLNPEKVFLRKEVIERLREHDLYEKINYK